MRYSLLGSGALCVSGLVIWSTIICVRARGYHLALGLAGGRENGDWYIASCFCPRWGAGAVTKPQKQRGNLTITDCLSLSQLLIVLLLLPVTWVIPLFVVLTVLFVAAGVVVFLFYQRRKRVYTNKMNTTYNPLYPT